MSAKEGRIANGRRIAIAERREQVVAAVKAGASIAEAAKLVGVSRSQAQRDFAKVLDTLPAPALETWRRVQHQQILDAKKVALQQVRQGKLPAIDRLVALLRREAELLGLDAPAQANLLVGAVHFDAGDLTARLQALTTPVVVDDRDDWYVPPQLPTVVDEHVEPDPVTDDAVVVEVLPIVEPDPGVVTDAELQARAAARQSWIVDDEPVLRRPGYSSHGW